jgi:hypothetical protein
MDKISNSKSQDPKNKTQISNSRNQIIKPKKQISRPKQFSKYKKPQNTKSKTIFLVLAFCILFGA